ncbi:hypothetical protein Pyn_17094 [Prunus yedoensis var. nudiflora]|uniref:Uncharacterized protein n=1 Tax=Prunus yedoensis var. nudiflora TaxID=2094558 RepID=A0A314UTI0_PRUYE|nr:hypothetical protein Pyn_17094 [Prunus yedoensis var. nudiflora]
MCRIAEEGERRHQRLRRRRWPPEYSRSTLPFPLSVDWSMPSALPRTLPTTAKSCTTQGNAYLSLSKLRLPSSKPSANLITTSMSMYSLFLFLPPQSHHCF